MQFQQTKSERLVRWFKVFYKQRYLQLFVIPGLICMLLFYYAPLFGLQIAFKDYNIRKGIWESPWVGLKHFDQLLHDVTVWPAVKNTVVISTLNLLVGFPVPIIFAVMLNEMRFMKIKRIVQTISYFPHFIAYSVVALMLSNLLSVSGIINRLLLLLGAIKEPYLFLGDPKAFKWISLLTSIWKTTGWNSIIYLAAFATINPDLYDAATIDGAGRFKRIWHITLPGVRATIVTLLILKIGTIVNGANFDLSYLLSNPLNNKGAEILPTYVLRNGISMGRFSYGTALGLVQSLVSLLLVLCANTVCNKISGEGLF